MIELALEVVDGWAKHAASPKSAAGASRFTIQFPANLVADQGARHLILNDAQGGYEQPTRDLLERQLRPGDLFLDVGAHWGFFSLQAATHPSDAIRVIAFEPDPGNAAILFRNINVNGLADKVQLVSAACGAGFELAPLVTNTTMGGSIFGVGLKPPFARGPASWAAVVSLDTALQRLPHVSDGRVLLKIDVEGYEPQVIAGASNLLDSGRVALIIWERGHAFIDGTERVAMVEMTADLTRRGFRHWRPQSGAGNAPLIPFAAEDDYLGNVFSFGPSEPLESP